MPKKEITFRPMFGFRARGRMDLEGTEQNIPVRVPRQPKLVRVGETPVRPLPETDKDELIRQLRASLALLEAREAERKAKTAARVGRHRAKEKPK